MAATGQLFFRPANPGIARAQVPGRGAPAEQRQPLALIFSNVTEMLTDQSSVLQIMMSGDQLVPARALLFGDGPNNEVVQNVLFLDIGQSNRLCHAQKKQQEKSLSSFYFRFLQPGDAIIGFLESAVVGELSAAAVTAGGRRNYPSS